jgi:hypothetical protein
VDGIIGGWQASTLFTFHSGNPINCTASGIYNTNYLNSSLCILAPWVTKVPESHLQFDNLGFPSLFANVSAGNDFVPGYSGQVGYRGILRGLHYWNDDMSVSKVFKIRENKQISFRVEAYNLTNTVTFANSSSTNLAIAQVAGKTSAGTTSAFGSTTFGEITKTSSSAAPRVLQMALRFTF